MSNRLSRDSWLFFLRGILAIALGVLAFVVPGPTLAALIAVFAFYAIFDGVLAIVAGFSGSSGSNWGLVLAGIAGIAIGAITIASPGTTAIALVLLVGIWAIATGVAEIIAAFLPENLVGQRWLVGLSGIVSLVFGVLLVVSPGAGVLSVLWLIGFYAIFAGIMYLAIGFRLRGAADTLSSISPETTTPARS